MLPPCVAAAAVTTNSNQREALDPCTRTLKLGVITLVSWRVSSVLLPLKMAYFVDPMVLTVQPPVPVGSERFWYV